MFVICCLAGAGTRTPRHRLRMAGMTLEVELAQRIMRQEAMYFSMVRRSPCCASLLSLSASVSTTTECKNKVTLINTFLANISFFLSCISFLKIFLSCRYSKKWALVGLCQHHHWMQKTKEDFRGGVLFENRPALYFYDYISIAAYKIYIFWFRIEDTV